MYTFKQSLEECYKVLKTQNKECVKNYDLQTLSENRVSLGECRVQDYHPVRDFRTKETNEVIAEPINVPKIVPINIKGRSQH